MDDKKVEPRPQEEKKSSEQPSADIAIDLVLAQKKAEEYLAGWQRAKADYINFKKETAQRQGELMYFATAALILELLPINDNFYAASKHLPKELEKAEWVKGVLNIKKQFDELLKNIGLEPIKTVGEKFNVEYHEAVSHEVKPGLAGDVIYEEIKPGYFYNKKVLRPAQVRVAK